MDRAANIDKFMEDMPKAWRYHWCEPTNFGCCCIGCSNKSGGLEKNGFTKKDHEEWMCVNPIRSRPCNKATNT